LTTEARVEDLGVAAFEVAFEIAVVVTAVDAGLCADSQGSVVCELFDGEGSCCKRGGGRHSDTGRWVYERPRSTYEQEEDLDTTDRAEGMFCSAHDDH
jgi:hypothetical protein